MSNRKRNNDDPIGPTEPRKTPRRRINLNQDSDSDDSDSESKKNKTNKNTSRSKKTSDNPPKKQNKPNKPGKPKRGRDPVEEQLPDDQQIAGIFLIHPPGMFMHSGEEPPVGPSSSSRPKTKKQQLEDRIRKSKLPAKFLDDVLSRLQNLDSEKNKQIEWFESLLRIPFGEYASVPITEDSSCQEDIEEYFAMIKTHLDTAVYGLDTVKEEITNYIAQFVSTSGNCSPRIIGLSGSPGVGKTSIIRRGLADSLKRPMRCISMGGITDSSHFVGFDYTYSGSRYGAIVNALMDAKVMNPIIFMDELDKISNTQSGIEVQNLLIHLTDPMQNANFQDKYFAGIDIDLTKVIFVFAYNDPSLINPILKDRIFNIHVPDPSKDAKVVIGQKYLVRELEPLVGIPNGRLVFSRDTILYIINHYCRDDRGVRGIKKCIESIMLKCNTSKYLGKNQMYKSLKSVNWNQSDPIEITPEMVGDLIKQVPDSNPPPFGMYI